MTALDRVQCLYERTALARDKYAARAEAAEAEVKRLRDALYDITNPDGQTWDGWREQTWDGWREVRRLRDIAETALGKKP